MQKAIIIPINIAPKIAMSMYEVFGSIGVELAPVEVEDMCLVIWKVSSSVIAFGCVELLLVPCVIGTALERIAKFAKVERSCKLFMIL